MTYVNINKLAGVSDSVRTTNNRLANAFSLVQEKANIMDSAWNGSASQNAMTAFYKIRNTHHQQRYAALESVARVLDAIATGYTKTEEKNTTIADQFR